MSSAAGYTNSGDVLAQERLFVYPAIGRQPASEMEQSGIELRTAGWVSGDRSDSPRARWSRAESSCALRVMDE